MIIRILMLSFLIASAPLLPARADDVTDQINQALAAYGRKDISTAMAGLEAALNLLRQSKAEIYGAILPPAPSGWTADPVETVALGVAAIGGGVGASRKYHRGGDTVTVSILADSPLLQAMSALVSSGLGALGGVKTTIVNGRRAIYMKDDNAFMSIVGDRILVRVEGTNQSEDTLKQFMTAVDFAAIERMAR